MTLTRPDITHAVTLVSHFMQIPNIEHFLGVKRILRDIKRTLNFNSELFHNHHVGFMNTQMLIGEFNYML